MPVTLGVTEREPVTFDGLRDRVAAFEDSGEVTKAGAQRLQRTVDMAERHHDRGADGRAIQELEGFQRTAGDPKLVPSQDARDALIADAEQLIRQLAEQLNDPGAAAPVRGSTRPSENGGTRRARGRHRDLMADRELTGTDIDTHRRRPPHPRPPGHRGGHSGDRQAGDAAGELTSRHPLRESLWVRLLQMLARSGRSAEALQQYEVIRIRLVEELGTDPGPELRRVYAELLADGATPEPVANVPRQLPASVDGFIGREAKLKFLDGLLDDRGEPGDRW